MTTQHLLFPDKQTAEAALLAAELAYVDSDGVLVPILDDLRHPMAVLGTVRQPDPEAGLGEDGGVQYVELPGYRVMIRPVFGKYIPEPLWPYEIDTPEGPYPDFM